MPFLYQIYYQPRAVGSCADIDPWADINPWADITSDNNNAMY